jgi:hypothetical protein
VQRHHPSSPRGKALKCCGLANRLEARPAGGAPEADAVAAALRPVLPGMLAATAAAGGAAVEVRSWQLPRLELLDSRSPAATNCQLSSLGRLRGLQSWRLPISDAAALIAPTKCFAM